jgi:hypothetical protein
VAHGQRVGRRRLVAQIAERRGARRKARRGAHQQLAPAPQRAIEQADLAGAGVDRRLAQPVAMRRTLHDIGRRGDRRGAGALDEVVEHRIDALGLEVFGKNRDPDATRRHR